MHPLIAACKWADGPEHEGSGYTVQLRANKSLTFDVKIIEVRETERLVVARWADSESSSDDRIYINLDAIVSAEILWS